MTPSTPTPRQLGNVTHLTEKGLKKLETELDYLRNVKREEIAQYLHDLVDDNELMENSEYLLAKDEQAIIEGRIKELETLLNRVEIIKPGSSKKVINLGSTVTVQEDGMPLETYTIVGYAEANAREGLISNESPMGRALMGHKVGDEIEVSAPDGKFIFRIISIR